MVLKILLYYCYILLFFIFILLISTLYSIENNYMYNAIIYKVIVFNVYNIKRI